eukprot:SAG31_NODE_4549_length_3146_cov_1.492944_4_plen_32_part_00
MAAATGRKQKQKQLSEVKHVVAVSSCKGGEL